MQIRLYLDEDSMSHSFARELRARGIDVTTVLSESLMGKPDSYQLEFANSQNRVVYTFNVADFCSLHIQYMTDGKEHAGVILAHQHRFGVGEQIRRVLKLVSTLSAEDMRNRVEYLSAWG